MNTDRLKRIFLLFVPCIFLVSAPAQDTQRFETFGGYSLSHDNSFIQSGSTFSGWDTSTTVFINHWFGVTSDFSGHYGAQTYPFPQQPIEGLIPGKTRESGSNYTYLFGPHFTYHHSRYAPFAQATFGVHHTSLTDTDLLAPQCIPPLTCGTASGNQQTSVSGSDTKFAMAVGGGLDIALGHGIYWRPFQLEYLLQRECCALLIKQGNFQYSSFNDNTFRYSTGITFRFGPHLGSSR